MTEETSNASPSDSLPSAQSDKDKNLTPSSSALCPSVPSLEEQYAFAKLAGTLEDIEIEIIPTGEHIHFPERRGQKSLQTRFNEELQRYVAMRAWIIVEPTFDEWKERNGH